jgi:hypothetical protein
MGIIHAQDDEVYRSLIKSGMTKEYFRITKMQFWMTKIKLAMRKFLG